MSERDGAAAGGCFFGVLLVVGLAFVATINGMGDGGIYQAENGTPVSRLSWRGWQPLDGSSRPTSLPRPTSRPVPTGRPRPTPEPAPTAVPRPTSRPTSRPWPTPFPTPAYRSEMASLDDWKAPAPVVAPPAVVTPGNPWPWAFLAAAAIALVAAGLWRIRRPALAPAAAAAAIAPGPRLEEEPMPFAPDLDHLTALLVEALGRLGLAYKRQDGTLQGVEIKRRQLAEEGEVLLLEVDTERLPRGVRADQLAAGRTLHHLTAVLHRPVLKLNTTGLTYAVLLDQRSGSKPKLPRSADLSEAMRAWPGTAFTFPVGEGLDGPVWETLRGHYLIGGETSSGKTTWIVATVLALAAMCTPDELALVIVDPKGVDLVTLGNLPHAAGDVATSLDEAAAALAELVAILEERRRLFLQAGQALGAHVSNLEIYNRKTGQTLPRVLAIVDEVTDLAMQLGGPKGDFFRNLVRLASIGRSFGVHLFLATQNPKAEVLDTLARGNLAGRICFRVPEAMQSRVVLGENGAEKLPRIPGRMLAKLDGRLLALQGYMVPEADLQALATMGRLQKQQGDAAPVEIPLTDIERRMVRYAIEHLNGRFPEKEIVKGLHLKDRDDYRRARGKLEALGILDRGTRGRLRVAAGVDVDEL